MYRHTTEQEKQRVLDLGREGLPTTIVATRTGVSVATAWRWLKEARLLRRKRGEHGVLVDRAVVIGAILRGESDTAVLARCFGCSRERIRAIVRAELGAGLLHELNRKVKRTDFLRSIETEEQAYVLGLIHAEGHVSKRGDGVVFGLQEEDGYIVERVRKALHAESKLGIRLDGFRVCFFGSKELASDANRHGVVLESVGRYLPEESVPHHLRGHFLRGLADGDGCIQAVTPTRLHWDVAGSLSVVETMGRWLVEDGILAEAPRPEPVKKRFQKPRTWRIRIGRQEVLMRLRDYLYRGASDDLLMRRRQAIWFARTPASPSA